MLLNTLQCTGQLPTTKNAQSPDGISAEVEKPMNESPQERTEWVREGNLLWAEASSCVSWEHFASCLPAILQCWLLLKRKQSLLWVSGRHRRALSELRAYCAKDTKKCNLCTYTNRRHVNSSILLVLLFFLKGALTNSVRLRHSKVLFWWELLTLPGENEFSVGSLAYLSAGGWGPSTQGQGVAYKHLIFQSRGQQRGCHLGAC